MNRAQRVAEKLGISLNGAGDPASSGDGQRPRIEVEGRFLRDITRDALAALEQANDPPWLFQRGRALVRVESGGLAAEALDATALKGILDRAADFVAVRETKAGLVEHPRRPPADLAPDILTLPSWPFPTLRGLSAAPVFLPGGRLLASDGYDAESGMLLRLGNLAGLRGEMAPAEALRWLRTELLGDFPFADEASAAHALAAVLQPFVRPLIDGPTPIYLIDAPAPGTGKGLLADVLSVVSAGAPAAVMALGRDEDEIDKRITALLLRGSPAILLDNVTELRSSALAAVLTTTTWRGRRLGRSEMIEVPNAALWLATGNNVALSDELTRRAVPVRLDAGVEQPEARTGFRHPDLLAWARERRRPLVEACLSLVRAWVDAGMPRGSGTLGRFEGWAAVLGGILEVAGVPGFLGGRDRLHAEADRETREWCAVCAAWWEAHGGRTVTAGDVFTLCRERGLLLDVWAGRSALGAQQRLGHALASRRDRVYAGFAIRSAGQDSATRNAAYRLERRPAKKTPETPETPGETPKTQQPGGNGQQAMTGVLDGEAAKHPQNTRGENPQNDGVFDPAMGVSGVSGVFARGHSPGGTRRAAQESAGAGQRPGNQTPETPGTPGGLPATCQYPRICGKLGPCDELWCMQEGKR